MTEQTNVQNQQTGDSRRDQARSLEAEIAARTREVERTVEQLREAQRLAQVGSWEFDTATQQLTWSDEMFRIFGRDIRLGLPQIEEVYQCLAPADRPVLRQAVAQAVATGQPYALEHCIRLADGHCRYVVSRGEAQCDAQGQVVRLFGTAADITDRKVAELALANSEEKRRLALELTNTGSWEFALPSGQARWSDSHYRLMGLVPQTVPASYETWRDRVHPEDLEFTEAAFQTAIDGHTLLAVEYRVVHPDGQVRWVLTKGQAVYAEDGMPLSMVGVMMDISDRKQAEADLRASQAKYQRLVDDIGDKFIVFSHSGTPGVLTYVSGGVESVFGLSRAEAINKNWMEIVNWLPETLERAHAYLSKMREDRADFQQFEMQFIHRDGAPRTIVISQHPVRDPSGHLIAVEGIVEDITDRKQAEQELQRLNAQLQALATTDSLTQVANRRQFLTTLEQEWSRHQRAKIPIAILMLDIDHFKAYNDTYGHPAGDQCLVQIADLLKDCMRRSGDLVARFGGEEFIMLLPNTDQAGAIAIAQRLQDQITDLALSHAASPTAPYITVSLGIVVVRMPTCIPCETAIAQADKMLYAAKLTRNTYRIAAVD